jgi:hypothetical protein
MKNNNCPIRANCNAEMHGDCFSDFLLCAKFKEYAEAHKEDLAVAKATNKTVGKVAKQKTATDDLFGSVEDAVFTESDENI